MIKHAFLIAIALAFAASGAAQINPQGKPSIVLPTLPTKPAPDAKEARGPNTGLGQTLPGSACRDNAAIATATAEAQARSDARMNAASTELAFGIVGGAKQIQGGANAAGVSSAQKSGAKSAGTASPDANDPCRNGPH